jgi:hypothetical protein
MGLEARIVFAVSATWPGGASIMALRKSTYSSECIPSSRRFIRDHALPRTVRGPVDFFALRRFEASRADVRVGDLRNDMGKPTFRQHPSVYHSDTDVKLIKPVLEARRRQGDSGNSRGQGKSKVKSQKLKVKRQESKRTCRLWHRPPARAGAARRGRIMTVSKGTALARFLHGSAAPVDVSAAEFIPIQLGRPHGGINPPLHPQRIRRGTVTRDRFCSPTGKRLLRRDCGKSRGG